MPPARILITEDEPIIRIDVAGRLEQMGYEVVGVVSTGEQAMALAGEKRPDLVLMDIRLEGPLDGVAAAQQIRERFHIPIVFLTAYSEEATLQRAKLAEPFGYILKPFEDRELRTAIEIALYKNQAEAEIRRLTRLYAALSQVNQALVRAQTREELLREVCRVTVEFGGFKLAWVGWVDSDSRIVRPVAQFGDQYGYLGQIDVRADEGPLGRGPAGQAIRLGRPCVCNDWGQNPEMAPWREAAARAGIRASAAFPLKLDGQVCGAFLVCAGEVGFFLDKERHLLAEAADDISFGLDLLETRQRRDKAEQDLRASEERYRSLYEQSPAGIYRTTPDGRILLANPAILKLLGYTSLEDLQSRNLEKEGYAPDSPRARFKELLERDGEVHGFEATWRTKDGRALFVLESARLIHDRAGKPLYYEGTIEDITPRKLAEQALHESEERYRLLADHAEDFVVMNRADERRLYVSPSFTRVTGWTLDDLQGSDWRTRIHPEDLPDVERARAANLRGEATRLEHRVRCKDGAWIWVENRCRPVLSPEGRVEQMVMWSRDVTERRRAEAALQTSEAHLRAIFRAAREISFVTAEERDGVMVVREFSPGAERLFGYTRAEMLGQPLSRLYPPEEAEVLRQAGQWARTEQPVAAVAATLLRQSGARFPGLLSRHRLPCGPDGAPCLLEVVVDLSEQQRMELQLAAIQRQETIGRLAAGIAHDFNNVLAIVLGRAEMLLENVPEHWPHRGSVSEIMSAAERGAALTQQILSFARKQVIAPRVGDLNEIIRKVEKLLRRTLGEHLEFAFQPAAEPLMVKIDAGQFEQALTNLAANARDAMGPGGRLEIHTSRVPWDATHQPVETPMPSGEYALVAVTDTGSGMSPDILKHLFEPYFTTKERGRGTGLGLASSYGNIKQAGGFIWVESAVGKGSTFKVYLPLCVSPAAAAPERASAWRAPAGSGETILVVEDDPVLENLIRQVLQGHGYRVLSAPGGEEALRVAENHPEPIALLLSDVIMPKVGGPELARRLRVLRPGLRVVFMSGYTDDMISRHGELEPGVVLLEKPFKLPQMLAKVREVLGAPAPPVRPVSSPT